MVVQLQTVSKAGEVVYASAYRTEQQLAQGTWTAFDPCAFKGKEKEEVRIISQNGMNDYPYEQSMIFVNYKEPTKLCIAMCGDGDSDNYAELGEYDSEDDAKFALQYFSAMYVAGVKLCETLSANTLHELRTAFLVGRKNNENIAQFVKRKAAEL